MAKPLWAYHARDLELKQAWGTHVGSFEWSHFATLTFARPTSPDGASRAFRNVWLRCVARMAQRPVPYFRVIERGAGGHWHIHALVYGTAHLSLDAMRQAWNRFGEAHIVAYDSERYANFYVAKTMADQNASDLCEVSRRVPPRRLATAA